MPTRKWFATQVTALAAIATMWATTGSWDTEETVALIGLLSQASVSWLVPNTPRRPRVAKLESRKGR